MLMFRIEKTQQEEIFLLYDIILFVRLHLNLFKSLDIRCKNNLCTGEKSGENKRPKRESPYLMVSFRPKRALSTNH